MNTPDLMPTLQPTRRGFLACAAVLAPAAFAGTRAASLMGSLEGVPGDAYYAHLEAHALSPGDCQAWRRLIEQTLVLGAPQSEALLGAYGGSGGAVWSGEYANGFRMSIVSTPRCAPGGAHLLVRGRTRCATYLLPGIS